MKTLPENKHYLVLDNLGLVNYVINKNFKYYMNLHYEDLYQEGCLGLVKSAIYFDESLGVKFSTYAIPTIDGYIRRYTRDKLTLIKMPRKLIDLKYLVMRSLESGMTEEEIKEEYNIESKHIAAIIAINSIGSIDYNIEGKDGDITEFHEILADKRDYYEEFLTEESLTIAIQDFTASIKNEDHRHIYEEYLYSMLYYEKITQVELAEKYPHSQSYISRLIREYNSKFQRYLKRNLLVD